MIRIRDLPLPPNGGMEELKKIAAATLSISTNEISKLALARQSIDARKRSDVHFVCTVDVTVPHEQEVVRRADNPRVTLFRMQPYQVPAVRRRDRLPPVVVGMGPAGLFAALFLARAGIAPIVLERGRPVEQRTADVERFWHGDGLDEQSNVQFGEGGAGTFSDGKLTTGTHDPRISAVLEAFVTHGAPEDILWSHKPHIGTDVLRGVIKSIREELIARGCDLRFSTRLCGIEAQNGRIAAVEIETEGERRRLPCSTLILAPGHSARDTFALLARLGIPMEQKPFAIGVRIEHQQIQISRQQYGDAWKTLPPADYKLACHLPGGRSAFTFCVCPGGQVVAAASTHGQVVTNGMSLRARGGENINGGLLVGVEPADFGGSDPLAGVRFQELWERAAFRLGGGDDRAPAQRVEDFLAARPSREGGDILPTYRPGVTWTALDNCLPPFVTETLRSALPVLDGKLTGFTYPDAIMTGVETRSSSPVRILRDGGLQSPLHGLYPCGEGAGYAGGIVSAAVDGIRVAEAVAQRE